MMAFAEVGVTLDELLEKTGDLIHVMDVAGNILYTNSSWRTTLGFDPAAVNFFAHVLHPDYRATFQALLPQLQRGLSLPSIEWTLHTAHDEAISVRGSLIPRREAGELAAITSVLRDITAVKRYYIEMDHIFQLSVDMLGIVSADGIFEKLNPAWKRVLGYDLPELLGHYFLDFVHPDDVAYSLEAALKASPEAPIINFENRYRHKDGSYRWLSWNATLYPDDQRTYFVARDVSERKQTEMHLSLRNRAIEFSPSAISIADFRQTDMPLIYINPAFERSTGYSASEILGRNCRFLQGDDRDQPELDAVRAALREKRTCNVVLRNYRKNGELFYNELRLAPIFNETGDLTHYVGISTDVTARVADRNQIAAQNAALLAANHELALMRQEAEQFAQHIQQKNAELIYTNQELAAARKTAEDAARLKTQFLATMSHELRTPLNAIIGYTEIQLAGMAGPLSSEQFDYEKRVLANADHLLELINDVLDIAKIEAGRLELVNKPFHLRRWVAELVEQTRGLADEKALAYEAVIDERMPEIIVSDPARMKQMVINLVSNAFKFTEHGSVKVHVQRHGRDAFKIVVSDTGMGIPSHLLETIFEEFRQVDSTSQRQHGGTGLGLAIVRKLALVMGGNVRVSSQLGTGSIFTLFLPLAEAKAHAPLEEENKTRHG